jgi:hypothetical protein
VAAGALDVRGGVLEDPADVDPRVGRPGADLDRVVDDPEDDTGLDALDVGVVVGRLRNRVASGRPARVRDESGAADDPVVDRVDGRFTDRGV